MGAAMGCLHRRLLRPTWFLPGDLYVPCARGSAVALCLQRRFAASRHSSCAAGLWSIRCSRESRRRSWTARPPKPCQRAPVSLSHPCRRRKHGRLCGHSALMHFAEPWPAWGSSDIKTSTQIARCSTCNEACCTVRASYILCISARSTFVDSTGLTAKKRSWPFRAHARGALDMRIFESPSLRGPLLSRFGSAATCAVVCAVAGCATSTGPSSSRTADSAHEDVYVLRSVREERTPNSTWCTSERAGFSGFQNGFHLDDRFSMWSVAVDTNDAHLTNSRVRRVGELRTCLGPTPDPRNFNFYIEGQLATLSSLSGSGACSSLRPNFPEQGIATWQCSISLRDLPTPYVGGVLISNTIVSKAVIGGETDPPGYIQSSVATVRVWRSAK